MTGPIHVDPGEEHGAANHFRALAADFNDYEPDDDGGDYASHHAARGLKHAIKRTGRGLSDRLSATGDRTTRATDNLEQQDQDNGQQISAVGEGLDMSGMAAMISAFSQPAGQAFSGGSQAVTALGSGVTQAGAQVGGQMLNAGANLAKTVGAGSAVPASSPPDAGAGGGGGAGAAPTEPAGGCALGPQRSDSTAPEPGRPVSYQGTEPATGVNPQMGAAGLGMVRPPVVTGGNEKEDKMATRRIVTGNESQRS